MAKTNKTTPKSEKTESQEKSSDQKEETGPEVEEVEEVEEGPEPDPNSTETGVAQSDPKQVVADYTDSLSEIVKNHHINYTHSKTSDYNQLMHKIENLKSDILKFIG